MNYVKTVTFYYQIIKKKKKKNMIYLFIRYDLSSRQT